jgi:hypothetical protein
MTPRSDSSRIASGFSGRAAGIRDPRGLDGDPTEEHVVQGPTRREPGAAAAGGKIANQPVRGSVVGCLAGLDAQRCGGVAGGRVPANEEFAGAGVEKNEAGRVQWQRTLLKEARREVEQSSLAARRFDRVLQIQAGVPVMPSRTRRPLGRTSLPGRRGAGGNAAAAWPNRKDGCSAWSSCSARARASRTESDTPRRFPSRGGPSIRS